MSEQQIFEFDPSRHFKKYLSKEYFTLPDATQKMLLESWRADKTLTIEDQKKALGISEGDYYLELKRLGVEVRNKKPAQKKQKLASPKKLQSSCGTSFFKGTINPDQLQDELTRIALSIDENADLYNYSIELEKLSE